MLPESDTFFDDPTGLIRVLFHACILSMRLYNLIPCTELHRTANQ